MGQVFDYPQEGSNVKTITTLLTASILTLSMLAAAPAKAASTWQDYLQTTTTFAERAPANPDVMVVFVPEAETLQLPSRFSTDARNQVSRVADVAEFTGKSGQVVEVIAPAGLDAKRLWLMGTGTELEATKAEELGATIAAKLTDKTTTVMLDANGLDAQQVAHIAHGMDLRNYRFDRYKKEPKPRPNYAITWQVADTTATEQAYAQTQPLAHGVFVARDIINLPGSDGYPKAIAELAKVAAEPYGIKATILTPEQVKELGMGSLYGVSQGSQHKAHMLILEWQGAGNDEAPIALVGKGNTFDTGGYNLKTSGGSILRMQTDKAGGAAVIGAVMALAGQKADVNVAGVVPLSHNLISGSATLPGDVLIAGDGTRIEVTSTDAEGRLILADGIWYARDRLKARAIADIATLTGSKVGALGTEYSAVFTPDETILNAIKAAGDDTAELVWQLPLGPYDGIIDSWLADIKNTGGPGAQAGARFLQHFAQDTPWVHIDMAGNAYSESAKGIHPAGGNGYGVRLLTEWVKQYDAATSAD